MSTLHSLARLATGSAAFALAGSAAASDTTSEFWPELQVWWRLSPSAQLLFNPAPTRSKESDSRNAVDWGLYFDYRVPHDPASYRIGYVYSINNPDARCPRAPRTAS